MNVERLKSIMKERGIKKGRACKGNRCFGCVCDLHIEWF